MVHLRSNKMNTQGLSSTATASSMRMRISEPDQNNGQQKVWNEHRRSWVILGNALTGEQSEQRQSTQKARDEHQRQGASGQKVDHACGRQKTGGKLQNGDLDHHQWNHAADKRFREVFL